MLPIHTTPVAQDQASKPQSPAHPAPKAAHPPFLAVFGAAPLQPPAAQASREITLPKAEGDKEKTTQPEGEAKPGTPPLLQDEVELAAETPAPNHDMVEPDPSEIALTMDTGGPMRPLSPELQEGPDGAQAAQPASPPQSVAAPMGVEAAPSVLPASGSVPRDPAVASGLSILETGGISEAPIASRQPTPDVNAGLQRTANFDPESAKKQENSATVSPRTTPRPGTEHAFEPHAPAAIPKQAGDATMRPVPVNDRVMPENGSNPPQPTLGEPTAPVMAQPSNKLSQAASQAPAQAVLPSTPQVTQPLRAEKAEQDQRLAPQATTTASATKDAMPIASPVSGGIAPPQAWHIPTSEGTEPKRQLREASLGDRADPRLPITQTTTPPSPTPANAPQTAQVAALAPQMPPSAPIPPGEDTWRGAAPFETALPEIRFGPETTPRPGLTPAQQMPQTADLPRHIAQQMAEALHRAGGTERGVDLLLNPAELGRVRINLSPGEAGLTVQIMADRPETLDLMRRHIDLLAQDFQSIGYEATSFAFAQNQDDTPKGGAPHDTTQALDPDHDSPAQPAPIQATIATDRVDIRL